MARSALGKGLEALIPKNPLNSVAPQAAAPQNAGGESSIQTLPIQKIAPNPFQPRQTFKEETLQELAASIKSQGILQPVIVSPTEDPNRFEIIAGERRWRAAQKAGLLEIPVIIRKVSERQRFEMSLLENLQREDLNAIEEAQGYQRLHSEFGLSHDAIATALGKDRSGIANTIRLLQLEVPIQNAIREGRISAGHGRALLGISDAKERAVVFDRILKEGLNVRSVETVSRESKKPAGTAPKTLVKNPEIRAYEQDLQQSMGRKVELDSKAPNAAKGWLKMEYYSLDDLEALRTQLKRVSKPEAE